MRLQELTLSGFKSFAKRTTFHFPADITAIVGPNGSGKSNIAEAIRWVLGEQSIKSLRGKRGEDLIFNGSAKSARMGKAGVDLCFDNRDNSFPIEFESVAISRKIFRDGTNDYGLNGSSARLKDIVELIARVGLGESKHNIIGQGEVDRFLSSGPRERREFLEEALGLRLWQLKKREAERKLERTAENMRDIESLLREIRPHLKFMKLQADKAERRETLETELKNYYLAYISGQGRTLRAEAQRISDVEKPTEQRLKALEQDIAALGREISASKGKKPAEHLGQTESELRTLGSKQGELERELGRIEGRLEAEAQNAEKEEKNLGVGTVKKFMASLRQVIQKSLTRSNIDEVKAEIRDAVKMLDNFSDELGLSGKPLTSTNDPSVGITERRASIQNELAWLEKTRQRLEAERQRQLEELKSVETKFQERWQELRRKEEEAAGLKSGLERLGYEKERMEVLRRELERITAESRLEIEEAETSQSQPDDRPAEELKKKIETLRLRLEDIGGIDQSVMKEYSDTQKRHDFLVSELKDLNSALKDLEKLSSQLEERIERDFRKGFADINREFQNYFNIIFGGGRGNLEQVALPTASQNENSSDQNGDPESEMEYGVDINVDIPRKRIKGLAMLSGGERALVSISLLLAMSAVNPPPFLVLDETDAALDEANSQKYGTILKELSKKTQLILVTHNRETMKQAGVLYGVTMGEDGISKIFSLKLEEAESYGNR